ncbi:Oidioi.mRNA.OKI2018_I69.chr2.g4320.t1.cds [Oikopleura dioica]|uniref:Oidioi.mRNA.OKI2018_I69.chr2.g4320.t1.cds n=1 Tax=Oikopleura dioica TaxID=34765 RepID=A0ABN7SWQ6_OIKDI|nr:Oidioi.mRNA.OKI2018_I69.chr2.g4320.t1.cds [Oikopleura dioica]
MSNYDFSVLILLINCALGATEAEVFLDSGGQLSISCDFDGVYLDLRRVDERGRESTLLTMTPEPFYVESGWNIDDRVADRLRLRKDNTAASDKGTYICTNRQRRTQTTYVTIYVAPEVEFKHYGEIETRKGSKIKIATCTAKNSHPAAEIQWRDRDGNIFDGVMESSSTAENGLSSVINTLELIAEKSLSGASFECLVRHRSRTVSGPHSGQFSPEIKVTWEPSSPKISEILPSMEDASASADKKTFECVSSGSPEVSYTWRLFNPNKTDIDTSHWKITGNRISTEEVKLTDSGLNIECVAENSLGRVSSVTLLDISTNWLTLISTSRITMVVLLVVSLTVLLCLSILLFRCAKSHRTVVYKTGTQSGPGREDQV